MYTYSRVVQNIYLVLDESGDFTHYVSSSSFNLLAELIATRIIMILSWISLRFTAFKT
jgi:hypothetical protein